MCLMLGKEYRSFRLLDSDCDERNRMARQESLSDIYTLFMDTNDPYPAIPFDPADSTDNTNASEGRNVRRKQIEQSATQKHEVVTDDIGSNGVVWSLVFAHCGEKNRKRRRL